MPRDVVVAFVHGIYSENASYSNDMQDCLRRALPPRLRPHLKFAPVFWGEIVRPHSRNFLHQIESQSRLRPTLARRFIVEGLGDAAAYQKTHKRENSAYYLIQQQITETLRRVDAHEDPSRPLVFIAHSLGCHIVSSYAWDISRMRQMSEAELAEWDDRHVTRFVRAMRTWPPMRRLETLAGIVTMGSNMPLFTFSFGPENVFPITRSKDADKKPAFPGSLLPAHVAVGARWLNFYSRRDLLSYPLKPLNNAYRDEARIEDIRVQSEPWWSRVLLPGALGAPHAHSGYWTNRIVIARTAALLAGVIEAEDGRGDTSGATGPWT